MIGVCEVSGCEGKAVVKNLCSRHYQRLRKYGDVNYVSTKVSKSVCLVSSCNEYSLEGIPLCTGHLKKLKEVDNIEFFKGGIRICEIEQCSRGAVTKGLCAKHYKQLQKNRLNDKKENAVPVTMLNGERICNVEGCEQIHMAKGYCKNHYQTWRYKNESKKEKRS